MRNREQAEEAREPTSDNYLPDLTPASSLDSSGSERRLWKSSSPPVLAAQARELGRSHERKPLGQAGDLEGTLHVGRPLDDPERPAVRCRRSLRLHREMQDARIQDV